MNDSGNYPTKVAVQFEIQKSRSKKGNSRLNESIDSNFFLVESMQKYIEKVEKDKMKKK